MNEAEVSKSNLICLFLLLLGIALSLILMNLPLYSFDAELEKKKSPNTFVGDEKYLKVRAEVQEKAEAFRAQGFDVEIGESVLERVNSKGKTTSLITFTINQRHSRNVFSFLNSDLPSSYVLKLMLGLSGLSLAFALLGCLGSMDRLHRYLSRRSAVLRSLSCVSLLLAILLIPVFILMNNYTFSRQLMLYNKELITEGKEAFFAKMDKFLFDGQMGEEIGEKLVSMKLQHSPMMWMLIPSLFLSLLASIQLRFGRIRNTLLRSLLYIFVTLVCVITLYPYYVMTITAFRPRIESLDTNFLHLLPSEWIWKNLTDIVNKGVPRYLLNSLMVAGGATLIAMLCGIPAAYAMARMRFFGKKAFLGFVIMSQMFSPVVLLIGISKLMTTLHLDDSVWGLMLINAAFNQAFAIWLLRGTFISISPEMEQAALIDGCSTIGSLIRVLIPMAAPGIVTALIFVFINSWNEFTISLVLISNDLNKPITVGITKFSSFNMIQWDYLFAASLLATIPVVILFMCIEKHLTSGLTSGGVKG